MSYAKDSGNSTNFVNVAHSVDPATGKRTYSAPGYYEPFRNRPNYVVLTSAEVTKINFGANTTAGLKATGVTFVSNSKTFVVNTTKEIILSAGK
jgi:choline dehydrogenase-like flavoprotein